MSNLTLKQLRALVAVAQTGSFTDAAQSLHITQSALSGLIKELENTLSVQLVMRSTRRVNLSVVGQAFYPLAQKVLDDLEHAVQTVQEFQNLNRGIVRIAAPQLLASAAMPEIIAAFKKKYNDIELKLWDTSVENVALLVQSGQVDVGISPERDYEGDFLTHLLFEAPFVVVFPAHHPLADWAQVPWEQALQYPLIALQGGFMQHLAKDLQLHHMKNQVSLGENAPQTPDSNGIPLHYLAKPAYEVSAMTTALGMVSAGLGISACLPYANALIERYQLQSRALIEPQIKRKLFVLQKKARILSPAAEAFKQFVIAHFATLDPNRPLQL